MAGRAGQVARVLRPLGADGADAPGQGKVNAQPVLPPPFGLLALGLPLALVVLVHDDRNRLFRLREEPSPHTVVAKIAFQHDRLGHRLSARYEYPTPCRACWLGTRHHVGLGPPGEGRQWVRGAADGRRGKGKIVEPSR